MVDEHPVSTRRDPERPGGQVRRSRALPERLLLCLGLMGATASPAEVPPEQAVEVEHLLRYLETSDCEMVRNGKAYSGAEGASHVRPKYDHFRDEIDNTGMFVEMAATGSLLSGQPYEVHCPGHPPVPSADWLLTELQRYRASQ